MLDRILEMPESTRKGIFAVIVVVLLGAAVWAWSSNSQEDAARAAVEAQQARDAVLAPQSKPVDGTGTGTNTVPSRNDTGSDDGPAGDPDVPSLSDLTEVALPVSQEEFNEAVELADEFMTAYLTYTWETDPAEWAATIRPMVGSDLYGGADGGFPDGPLLEKMIEEKTENAADVQVVKVLMLSEKSIMFEVAASVRTTTVDGTTDASYRNQVSLSHFPTGWVVSEVYPVGTGDGGWVDPPEPAGTPVGGEGDGDDSEGTSDDVLPGTGPVPDGDGP